MNTPDTNQIEQPASYRESHKEKGADYHEGFVRYPHRGMVWRLEQRILIKIVQKFLADTSPRHLDFAAGTGRILSHLNPYMSSSTAVDVSESMLAVARENAPNARFIKGDITREDILANEKFDLITAFRFFPNAEQELRYDVIGQLANRLSDGGILVFNNHINNKSLLYRLSAIRRGTRHLRGMNDEDAVTLTEAVGLVIVKRYPIAIAPLGETRMYFRQLTYWLERVLAKLPGVAPIAQNVIYVCKRSSDR